MTLQKRADATGHFELRIDGHSESAYLKSVDGGFARAQAINESIGSTHNNIVHMSTVEVEPFSFDFGFARANDILKWISSSWRRNYGRRNGQITHASVQLYKLFEHEFFEALITETKFPKLDVNAKDSSFISVKVQPERILPKAVPKGTRIAAPTGSKQKLWTNSAFRFNIDGIDEMEFTTELESFTIKQGTKKYNFGEERFGQIEPTNIKFPTLSGTIPLAYASKLLEWHDKYVLNGQRDPRAQRTGSIEFLAPDRGKQLFNINLYDMGLSHVSLVSSQANQDQLKKLKFELYVGRMDLDGSGALGME